MKKYHPLFWGIVLIITAVLVVCSLFDLSFLNTTRFFQNIKIISTYFFGILPLLILVIFFLLLMTNKWAFKIEKLSLGGFNFMFDNPARLYKRSVRSFLDTKRSLFKIDFRRDNFDETLTSYYKTYEFFREEIKILDNEKKSGRWSNKGEQQELYNVTNEIVQVLNEFLTSHQNNYRRWYKRVADTDNVTLINGGKVIPFHMTPIAEVQKHYYGVAAQFPCRETSGFFLPRLTVSETMNGVCSRRLYRHSLSKERRKRIIKRKTVKGCSPRLPFPQAFAHNKHSGKEDPCKAPCWRRRGGGGDPLYGVSPLASPRRINP